MIGVLDLQGGVVEHLNHLRRIGIEGCRVKKSSDIRGLKGLILPGGESTCLAGLLKVFRLDEAILKQHHQGMKIWGTCAGAILLAKKITGETPHLALMDLEIERNGFGCQLDSFSRQAVIASVSTQPIPLIFIRAPKIINVGKGVNVLLKLDDYIAAAETPDLLATVFHPELTDDFSVHKYFLRKCGLDIGDSEFRSTAGRRLGFWGTANA